MQVCGSASLMVTRRFAVSYHLCLKCTVGTGLFVQIDIDDVSSLAHYACGA